MPPLPSTSASFSLPLWLVQHCPFIADENWAMEEYVRLAHQNPDRWYATTLPKEVWSPPETKDCPFFTAKEEGR